MKTSLTSGLNESDKSLFTQEFKSSPFLRKQISSVLSKKIDSYYVGMRDKSGYESPNWALSQADSIGYTRALNEIISLLE